MSAMTRVMFVDWESLLGEPTSQDMMIWYQVHRLQERYVRVLDTDRLEEWPELFTEDGVYEIGPEGNDDDVPLGSIMHCCGRRMLRDHVASLRRADVFEPHRYRHMTSGLDITQLDADTIEMQSNYMVVQTARDGEFRVYQAGRYFDRAVRTVDGWRYQRKRAIYDASGVYTFLAVPI
jgi:anthranilate 1,2-dioxygenase small subunit